MKIKKVLVASLLLMLVQMNSNAFARNEGVQDGYRGFVDAGYSLGVGDWGLDRSSISTIHGYQFNPYIFLGGGVGVNYYSDVEFLSVPTFVAFRSDFIDGGISPFAEVRLGYSTGDLNGIYFSPNVGCRFGLSNNFAINVSLGYDLEQINVRTTLGRYYSDHKKMCGAFTFRVGIEF